jgi:hypothetical protein
MPPPFRPRLIRISAPSRLAAGRFHRWEGKGRAGPPATPSPSALVRPLVRPRPLARPGPAVRVAPAGPLVVPATEAKPAPAHLPAVDLAPAAQGPPARWPGRAPSATPQTGPGSAAGRRGLGQPSALRGRLPARERFRGRRPALRTELRPGPALWSGRQPIQSPLRPLRGGLHVPRRRDTAALRAPRAASRRSRSNGRGWPRAHRAAAGSVCRQSRAPVWGAALERPTQRRQLAKARRSGPDQTCRGAVAPPPLAPFWEYPRQDHDDMLGSSHL